MLVNIELGQRTDVYFELALPGKRVGKRIVQPVDALNHQNIFGTEFFEIALVLPSSGFEIEGRQLHPATGQQRIHIRIELFDVDCVENFKIIISVFVLRCFLPVHEIIIHCNRMRPVAKRAQLNRKPVRKSRLSGGGRPGYHNEFPAAGTPDLLGNLRNLLFLIRLLHEDHLLNIAAADRPVQISHIVQIQPLRPAVRTLKNRVELFARGIFRKLFRLLSVRKQQKKAVFVRRHIKYPEHSRTFRHIPVKVIVEAVEFVKIRVRDKPVTE